MGERGCGERGCAAGSRGALERGKESKRRGARWAPKRSACKCAERGRSTALLISDNSVAEDTRPREWAQGGAKFLEEKTHALWEIRRILVTT